jgi:chemotaxis protein methyltransferase CheR
MLMAVKYNENDREFNVLKTQIFRDTSLDCRKFKENYLKRRIRVRMFARSLNTYGEYLRLLKRDPDEYSYLIDDITINVTQFFRDPEVFGLLEKEIIPLLIYNKVKQNRRVIRFWSAGCASGEEPYSIAIILKELLGEEYDNFLVSVYGTDIDNDCLRTARQGVYLERQLENVHLQYRKKFFKKLGDNYSLSEEIKDMVRFKNLDLFTDIKTAHYDVILCRNVIIYFNKDMQNKLFEKFYYSLNEGGYLVIGKTETLMNNIEKKFSVVNLRERIYQKTRK